MTDLVAQVAGFLERLGESERLVHALFDDAPLRTTLTLRGARPRTLLLDFATAPGRVREDDGRTAGHVIAAVDAAVLHDVLRGALTAGEAFGRRELLLRGSPADFVRLIPLFDVAPALYRAYLASQAQVRSEAQARSEEGGRVMLDRDRGTRLDRVVAAGLKSAAFAFGYGAGVVRYRLRDRVDLFEILASLSRGLGAATPADARPKKREGVA
jgi:hypothetical protein